jgi:beta-lactamase superfamily II metal-dependent hydrolase
VLERLLERNIRIRRTDQEGTIRYQTCKIGL